SLRQRLVSVFHAATGGAARQSRVYGEELLSLVALKQGVSYSFRATVTPSRIGISTGYSSFDAYVSLLNSWTPSVSLSSAAAGRAAFPLHNVLSVTSKPPRFNLGKAARIASGY